MMTDATVGRGALYEHVHGYAEQVRAHLADLRPEQVDELTDGLEANLAEAVADAPGPFPRVAAGETTVLDLRALFGPPDAYATELRNAAGLGDAATTAAPRARIGLRGGLIVLGGILASGWRSLWSPLTSTPQWSRFGEFVRSLAPVWWVVRGWAVATLALHVLGGYAVGLLPPDTPARLVVLAAIVVSVQLGRGRWLGYPWVPRTVRVLSVGAAVAAVPMLLVALSAASAGGYERGYQQALADVSAQGDRVAGMQVSSGQWAEPVPDGVWVDGMQVSNLFVFDAQGEPLRDVQIFDDRGRQVRTVPEGYEHQLWAVPDVDGLWYFRPATAADARERWNVYPLRAIGEAEAEFDENGSLAPATGVRETVMPWPFLKAPTAIPAEPARPSADDGSAEPVPVPDETSNPTANDESADGVGGPERPEPPAPATGTPAPSAPAPVVEAIG